MQISVRTVDTYVNNDCDYTKHILSSILTCWNNGFLLHKEILEHKWYTNSSLLKIDISLKLLILLRQKIVA